MDSSRHTVELQTADFLVATVPIQETNCCPPSSHSMTPLVLKTPFWSWLMTNLSQMTESTFLCHNACRLCKPPHSPQLLSPFTLCWRLHWVTFFNMSPPPWIYVPLQPPPQVVEAWWPLLTIMVVMWANTACRCVMDPGQYPLSYLQHKDKNMEKVFIKFKHRPMNFFNLIPSLSFLEKRTCISKIFINYLS
jgi:hypothetical protein